MKITAGAPEKYLLLVNELCVIFIIGPLLTGISGERIWVEVKKIAVGNYAGSLIKTMLQLGMSKFIGEFFV